MTRPELAYVTEKFPTGNTRSVAQIHLLLCNPHSTEFSEIPTTSNSRTWVLP
jgi:hypothetical protein